MQIAVHRQSVCLADDIENHTMVMEVSDYETVSMLFRKLIRKGYFPHVAGNDVVWTLFCANEDCASWLTKEDKLYTRSIGHEEGPTVYTLCKHGGRDILL